MAETPDVRALSQVLAEGIALRPASCLGCPFARPYPVAGGWVTCGLLGGPDPVNHERPPCTADHWRERARVELGLLEADNAVLAAVASDAREESLMYRRGLAEGAAAEREACCRAVCPDCAAGDCPWPNEVGDYWHGKPGSLLPGRWKCKADAIRRGAGDDGR